MSPNIGGGAKRPFFNRTFSKLERGSVRGSIFSLCAAAIGSGVLTLPYVLSLNGWVIGIFFVILGACSEMWGLFLLVEVTV